MARFIILACISILCSNQLAASIEDSIRNRGVEIARKYVGIKEKSGKNDGAAIKPFQDCVRLKVGQPWCAGFVCKVYQDIGYDAMMDGRAISCCENEHLINPKDTKPLDIFYYYSHTGLIEDWPVRGEYAYTIEGNHSDKVAAVRRKKKEFTKIANVLTLQIQEAKVVKPIEKAEKKQVEKKSLPKQETKKGTDWSKIIVIVLLLLLIFKR